MQPRLELTLHLSPRQAVVLAGTSLGMAAALAETYHAAEAWAASPWLAAAWVHTILASAVCLYYLRREPALFAWQPWQAYVPSLVILLGSAGLALASRGFGVVASSPAVTPEWAWILWIPVVEELVFRAGIGRLLRRWAPPLWAAWFAALVFALVHTNPTLQNIMAGRLGLALGPFLLGLCGELLLAKTRRILPAMAFHAACNATVAIFGMLDRRWLYWLGLLYS